MSLLPNASTAHTIEVPERAQDLHHGARIAVHEAASQLFWRLAYKVGVQDALSRVLDTNGEELFTVEDAANVVLQSQIDPSSESLLRLVMEEAVTHIRAERNLQGVIYADDYGFGSSPQARHLDTRELKQLRMPRVRSTKSAPAIQGRLCIRSPLPAIVYSARPHQADVVLVDNTELALGVHYPLLLAVDTSIQLTEELHALTGVFYFPSDPEARSRALFNFIPNALQFEGSILIDTPSSLFSFEIEG